MYKAFTIFSLSLIFCLPLFAEEISATACKHDTAECYEADLNIQDEYIIIHFSDNNLKEFDIEGNSLEDLSAFDDDTKTYYDIIVEYD